MLDTNTQGRRSNSASKSSISYKRFQAFGGRSQRSAACGNNAFLQICPVRRTSSRISADGMNLSLAGDDNVYIGKTICQFKIAKDFV
jgi:hypothetical protein